MGCDIHAYVEYTSHTYHNGESYWNCLIANAGSQDYTLFGLLAGVSGGEEPLFAPRGLPEGRQSYVVESAATLYISDKYADHDGYCSLQQAQSYGGIIYDEEGKPRRVHHPDWHSHSWLTYPELAQVLAHYLLNIDRPYVYDVEWDAILAAMKALEDRGHRTRIIFWFDN